MSDSKVAGTSSLRDLNLDEYAQIVDHALAHKDEGVRIRAIAGLCNGDNEPQLADFPLEQRFRLLNGILATQNKNPDHAKAVASFCLVGGLVGLSAQQRNQLANEVDNLLARGFKSEQQRAIEGFCLADEDLPFLQRSRFSSHELRNPPSRLLTRDEQLAAARVKAEHRTPSVPQMGH